MKAISSTLYMLGSVLPFNNRVGVAENPVVSIHFSCRSNSSATTVLFASISLLKNLGNYSAVCA